MGSMFGWLRRLFASIDGDPEDRRARLVDRKHQMEGEIRQLQRESRARSARGEDVGGLEARIASLQSKHYQLRLEIDRTR